MTLDTDAWYDGGIDRWSAPVEQDEPLGFEPGGYMDSNAETRATLGAATATAPDFSRWREEAEKRVSAFGKAYHDLQRGFSSSCRAEATEGGGILPAASGEAIS